MNRAGKDFLAGPALTQEQDRRLAAGGFLCFIYGLNHQSILPGDQPIASAKFFGEEFHLGLELRSFQRLLDHQSEMLGIEGFGNEVVGSRLHGLDGSFNRAVGGDDDYG